MGAGVTDPNPMVFKNSRLVPMLLRPERPRNIFRAGHDTATLVVQADQGQMGAHLCPEGGRHILGEIHALPAMVGQAQH